MHLESAYVFRASRERSWDLLMDTEAIGECLPGCRGLKPLGGDRYAVELGVAIAAIAGSFAGTVALEDKVPPASYTLAVEGSGRQGFVKGRARLTLDEDAGGTSVRIAADADVGGMIARVGQRLVEGVARSMMDRFFACLSKRLEA